MSVGAWFLADRDRTLESPTAPPAIATGRIAVLLDAGAGARGLGAVLALALAREARVPAVLVLGWHARGHGAPTLPSGPAARRLGRALRSRDLPARSSGRIVHLDLPRDDDEAATAASRAVAASPAEMPVVVVLGGARGPALDALLAGADLVVVAGPPDEPRARAALDGALEVGVPAVAWAAAPHALWRRLAGAGLGLGMGRPHGLPPEARR